MPVPVGPSAQWHDSGTGYAHAKATTGWLRPKETEAVMLKRILVSALLIAATACQSVEAPVTPSPEPAKVVIIGDSISLGLGAMGPDTNCPVTLEYSSLKGSYGVRVADALGTKYVMFAWPGKGLVRNYENDPGETISALMKDPDQIRRLDDTGPVRLVLVNVGTHDFFQEDPTDTFVPAMEDLLGMLVERYPDAIIYALTGPMLGGTANAFHDQAVQTAVAVVNGAHGSHIRYLALNGGDPSVALGCSWHPSIPAHEHMADMILEDLATQK